MSGVRAGVGAAVGAEVGADVGAAVGAAVGAGVAPGDGVFAGRAVRVRVRLGAGSDGAAPSTAIRTFADGVTAGSAAAAAAFLAGGGESLPPIDATP